jgi:hypothetical protein
MKTCTEAQMMDLLKWLARKLKTAREEVALFQARVAENPLEALRYSDAAVVSAGKVYVFSWATTSLSVLSTENVARLERQTFTALVRGAMSAIDQSTSAAANAIDRAKLAAYAALAEQIDDLAEEK